MLIDNNPTLHHLKMCQLPSWVCCPSLFNPRSQSSLVLAFEDPDRTIAPSLIKGCYLYTFGTQCCIKAWKQPPPSPTKCKAIKLAKTLQSVQSVALAMPDQHNLAKTMPVSVTQMSTASAAGIHMSLDLVTNTTFSSSGDKQLPPSLPKSGPSKKKK